jgi:LysM repeat protein
VVIRRIDDMAALFLQPHPDEIDQRVIRPQLTVIPGGRSTTRVVARSEARSRRRVFMARRLVVGILALIVLAATVSMVSSAVSQGAPAAPVPAVYQVQPGDTLWRIANSFGLDADTRDVVAELARANGGSSVVAGQRLVVPAGLRR